MLEDLFLALQERGDECYWWSANQQTANNLLLQGLPAQELSDPDVVFMADSGIHPVVKKGIWINLGHGLGSKGIFFTNRPDYIARENLMDYHFVPSELHRLQMVTYVPAHKLYVTGMPKLDKAFNNGYQKNIEWKKTVILFAPTFNEELSAIPVVKQDIMWLANSDTTMLVKLHDVTKQEWKDMYPHRIIADNIAPYLACADLVISDVSSALLEAMALGKRVISVMNPKQMEYPQYQENDHLEQCVELEYQKKCPIAQSHQELAKLVHITLAKRPEQFTELLDYRGTSIPRCIEVLDELIK